MKQKFKRIIAAGVASLMLLPIFSSCGGPENYKTVSYSALDTVMTVKISQNKDGGGRVSADEIKNITARWWQRVWEYQLFSDPETRKILESEGIELINYDDLVQIRQGNR